VTINLTKRPLEGPPVSETASFFVHAEAKMKNSRDAIVALYTFCPHDPKQP
jgi:hypothetical protein